MILTPKIPFRRRRRRAGTPVLLAATFNDDGLFLTFDRAIDLTGLQGTKIVVDQGTDGDRFDATGGLDLETPTRVRLILTDMGAGTGTGTRLFAAAGNGIETLDGGAWVGVNGLALNWP